MPTFFDSVCMRAYVTPAAGLKPKIERATDKYVHMRGAAAADLLL